MRDWWILSIGGYGEYAVYATKDEAEERKLAKAEWEGGGGRKRRADANKHKDVTLVEQARNQRGRSRAIGSSDDEELPPLEHKKEAVLNRGLNHFNKPTGNITYKPEKIQLLPSGVYLVEILDNGDVVEQHLFKTIERATNYVAIISLV
jgi:hypothetical protein